MLLEFALHDVDTKDIDIKNILNLIKEYNLDYISVLPYYTKLAKKIIGESNTKICCPIDYPLGILDYSSRRNEIENAIKNGAQKIDMVLPTLLLINKKYDKFREDIRMNYDLCLSNNVEINYILEYRKFDYIFLSKIAEILFNLNIKRVYPSTGYMLDNISDNMIACVYLNNKTNIKCISTADIWLKTHIIDLLKNKIHGIRFKNLNALKMFYETDKIQ